MQISASSTKPALQSGFLGVLTKNKTVEELRFKKYLMAYKYKNTFYQGLNNSLGAISYIVSLLFWKTLLITQLNSVETLHQKRVLLTVRISIASSHSTQWAFTLVQTPTVQCWTSPARSPEKGLDGVQPLD